MDDSCSWQQKFLNFDNISNAYFNDLLEQQEKWFRDVEKRTDVFGKSILKSLKSGDLDPQIYKETNEESHESDQENVPLNKRKGPKKKSVLSESSQDNLQQLKIKKEKISLEPSQPRSIRSSTASTKSRAQQLAEVPIKVENDDMPAPSWIPPKKKTKEIKVERASVRTTRTKGKKPSVRDSDVVVQSEPITSISLSDTEESDGEKPVQKTTRSTRTKTKTKTAQAESQSDSGPDTESESSRSTRTKTRNKKPEQTVENVEVEESRSTRTKTLRKGKKGNEDQPEEQENAPQETRSTRTKTIRKGTKAPEETTSEVVDGKEEPVAEPPRSTRTKTRKMAEKPEESVDTTASSTKSVIVSKESGKVKAVPAPNNQTHSKRNRSTNSTDDEANEKKRSKSSSPVVQKAADTNTTAQTVYEDARSTLGQPQDNQQHLNATYVASVPHATDAKNNGEVPPLNATVTVQPPTVAGIANSTVILDKPNFNIFEKKSTDIMFTDDDSDEAKTPPKKAQVTKASKEVFSPYEKTTLKKKVEAFEKLQNGSEIPVKSSSNMRNTKGTPSVVREKAKMFTPSSNRFMPSSSSTSKVSKFISYTGGSSSNESLLAMKSAQKESRERQKKQLEREQALKKKEAMLLAQTEAKKKANEEKQLKAAQQRKMLEVEKQKQLEQQKLKEAKLRQKEREREEYLQKQKQELEKKRAAQKKKVQEMQLHRQQILEEQARNPPVYMTSKPPKLPTEDCYDSDDPDYRKVTPPSWCVGELSRTKQLAILAAGEKIKNTLFCRHAQTPDLTEIFEVIDPKKLKRTSSVLWRKPPRYTMMPDLNETKFEEDDELFESD